MDHRMTRRSLLGERRKLRSHVVESRSMKEFNHRGRSKEAHGNIDEWHYCVHVDNVRSVLVHASTLKVSMPPQ